MNSALPPDDRLTCGRTLDRNCDCEIPTWPAVECGWATCLDGQVFGKPLLLQRRVCTTSLPKDALQPDVPPTELQRGATQL